MDFFPIFDKHCIKNVYPNVQTTGRNNNNKYENAFYLCLPQLFPFRMLYFSVDFFLLFVYIEIKQFLLSIIIAVGLCKQTVCRQHTVFVSCVHGSTANRSFFSCLFFSFAFYFLFHMCIVMMTKIAYKITCRDETHYADTKRFHFYLFHDT